MIFHTDRLQYHIDDELRNICKNILNLELNKKDWNAPELSDEFQTNNLYGGWDLIEQEFCFSYYNDNKEYWFQFTLIDAEKIVIGNLEWLDMRLADK